METASRDTAGTPQGVREQGAQQQKLTVAPSAPPLVFLMGEAGVQNRLLADLLERSGSCHCEVLSLDNLRCIPQTAPPDLILADVLSAAYRDAMSVMSGVRQEAETPVFGLINVGADTDVEPFLYWKEVRGIFRRDTDPKVLVRGVENMLAGNYWFPRGALDSLLDQTRHALREMKGAADVLTRRERTVLEALAEGASNEAIGMQLCISTHTVKSHLYNLFRKLDVSNRVEAAIWARRYLTYRRP